MVTPESPRKSGKKSAGEQGYHGQPGRHPTQQCARQANQSLRSAAFAEQIACESEKGNRQKYGHFRNAKELDGQGLQVNTGVVEIPHRAGGDHCK